MKSIQIPASVNKTNKGRLLILFIPILIIGVYFIYLKTRINLPIRKVDYIEVNIEKQKEEFILDFENVNRYEVKKKNVNWNSLSAEVVYAYNPETGKVYYSKNINTKRPIASITKLMTAYTAVREYEYANKISIQNSLPIMDLPVGLKAGDEISVNELLECMLVGSKNDCANTFTLDNTFIQKMNSYAQELGMRNSMFSNTTGFINTNNYSTAYDLGLLSSALIRNEKIIKITDSLERKISIEGVNKRDVRVFTTNVMLKENPNIKGLKTGFTYASGECLIVYYDYGNSEKLITIVLNSKDRFADSRLLYSLIIQAYN